jgi:hypothetical protein
VIAASGENADAPLAPLLEKFAPLEHTVEVFEGPRTDLMTYRQLIDRRPEATEFAFGNSYMRALASDWLRLLVEAVREPGVGIAGSTGSYESPVNTIPHKLGLLYLPFFKGYPTPHVRTTGFAIERATVEALDWPIEQASKRASYRFEGGRRGLTRQLKDLGLRPVVVGRDGKSYEIPDWHASETFRSGKQGNLLTSDLRSDDYENGDAAERERLARYAWGSGTSSA